MNFYFDVSNTIQNASKNLKIPWPVLRIFCFMMVFEKPLYFNTKGEQNLWKIFDIC